IAERSRRRRRSATSSYAPGRGTPVDQDRPGSRRGGAPAMLTATKDLMLPATVTGSWPRPRWYDGGLWGRPLDTALLDVRFPGQFLHAAAAVFAAQGRAGA